jgi:hypothetical protein
MRRRLLMRILRPAQNEKSGSVGYGGLKTTEVAVKVKRSQIHQELEVWGTQILLVEVVVHIPSWADELRMVH